MRSSTALLVGVVFLAQAVPARADVQLSIENGQVSLNATNATVREILAEWARVGQTRIVNGDRVPGGPVSIQLSGVTEEQALQVILRSVAGYVVAPRPAAVANASRYDRILVMPTSTPTRSAPPPQPPFPQPGRTPPFQPPQQFPQQPQLQQPLQFPQQPPIDDDDEVADEPAPNVVLPNPGTPIFNRQPRPVPQQQQQPPPVGFGVRPAPGQPSVGVTVPGGGVPVPGMVVPVPAQPAQPAAPRRPDREP